MILRCLMLAVIAALFAGCQNGPHLGGTSAPLLEQRSDAAWPFWPASMRIHPLTRIVEDDSTGREIIEARVEFTDAHNHMSKAVGFLRIELFAAANSADEITGWNIDLRDIAFNAQRFDDVSRTYLFRLRLEDGDMPEQPLLRAQFFSVNGTDLEAEHRVRR